MDRPVDGQGVKTASQRYCHSYWTVCLLNTSPINQPTIHSGPLTHPRRPGAGEEVSTLELRTRCPLPGHPGAVMPPPSLHTVPTYLHSALPPNFAKQLTGLHNTEHSERCDRTRTVAHQQRPGNFLALRPAFDGLTPHPPEEYVHGPISTSPFARNAGLGHLVLAQGMKHVRLTTSPGPARLQLRHSFQMLIRLLPPPPRGSLNRTTASAPSFQA